MAKAQQFGPENHNESMLKIRDAILAKETGDALLGWQPGCLTAWLLGFLAWQPASRSTTLQSGSTRARARSSAW